MMINCLIVTDRYGNPLSLWQSLRRRLWSLQYQKRYRNHAMRYTYDFNYYEVLEKELQREDLSDSYKDFLQRQQENNEMDKC